MVCCAAAAGCNVGGVRPDDETICNDGHDGDGDQFTDCDDIDCQNDPVCAPGQCGNGTCEPDYGEDEDTCAWDCTWECSDAVCDFSPQCGCDPGEKCTTYADNRVCDTAGSGSIGQVCEYDSECSAGTVCAGASDGFRTCRQFCRNDNDCSQGPGALCTYYLVYNDERIPGADLCTLHCDPANPTSTCPPGFTCLMGSDDGENFYTHCVEAGHATGICDESNLCVPGYFCDFQDNQCLQYCRVSSPSCNEGTCQAGGVFIGLVEYGYCG